MTIEIDLGKLEHKQWRVYIANPTQEKLVGILCSVVTGWDYEGDPAEAASYAKLTPEQMQAVQHELGRKITNFTAVIGFAKAAQAIEPEKPKRKRAKRPRGKK